MICELHYFPTLGIFPWLDLHSCSPCNLHANVSARLTVRTLFIWLSPQNLIQTAADYTMWHSPLFSSPTSCLREPSMCCHGIPRKAEDKRKSVKACHLPFHKLLAFSFYFTLSIFLFLLLLLLLACDFSHPRFVYKDFLCHFFKRRGDQIYC